MRYCTVNLSCSMALTCPSVLSDTGFKNLNKSPDIHGKVGLSPSKLHLLIAPLSIIWCASPIVKAASIHISINSRFKDYHIVFTRGASKKGLLLFFVCPRIPKVKKSAMQCHKGGPTCFCWFVLTDHVWTRFAYMPVNSPVGEQKRHNKLDK